MSIELVALVLNTCTELHISVKLTLIGLANHASPDGEKVFPSIALLARYSECDPRTIKRHLKLLVEEGWIEVVQEAHHHRPTEYRIRGDRLSPLGRIRGDTESSSGVTQLRPARGDTATSPRTVIEPSVGTVRDSNGHFKDFWKIYPNSAGRAPAEKAFARALKKVSVEELVAAAARYRDDPNRVAAYTLHGSTWLNQERWNDPPLPPRKKSRQDDLEDWLASEGVT